MDLSNCKRKLELAELVVKDVQLDGGSYKKTRWERLEDAEEKVEDARAAVRSCHASEAWEVASSIVGRENVQACATFAAGIVKANAFERTMREASEIIANALHEAVE